MSRDYKPSPQKNTTSKGSPFLSGLLVGVLLGVGASVAVTMYIKGLFGDKNMTTTSHVSNKTNTEDLTAKTLKSNKEEFVREENIFDIENYKAVLSPKGVKMDPTIYQV